MEKQKRSGAVIIVLSPYSATMFASVLPLGLERSGQKVFDAAEVARMAVLTLDEDAADGVKGSVFASAACAVMWTPNWVITGDIGNAEHVFELDGFGLTIRYTHAEKPDDLNDDSKTLSFTPAKFQVWLADQIKPKKAKQETKAAPEVVGAGKPAAKAKPAKAPTKPAEMPPKPAKPAVEATKPALATDAPGPLPKPPSGPGKAPDKAPGKTAAKPAATKPKVADKAMLDALFVKPKP